MVNAFGMNGCVGAVGIGVALGVTCGVLLGVTLGVSLGVIEGVIAGEPFCDLLEYMGGNSVGPLLDCSSGG